MTNKGKLKATVLLVTLDVRGLPLNIYLVPSKDWQSHLMKHSVPLSAAAYHDYNESTIYFNETDSQLNTILHELFHAWVASTFHATWEPSVMQIEEVCCEIFSNFHSKIVEQSNQILTLINNILNKNHKEK